MTKYKYKMEICSTEIEMLLKLNEMAEKGLRCVNVTYNTEKNKYIIVFEQEVNE